MGADSTSYYPLAEEQDKFLKEASNSVKKNAYFMRKAMDEDNLREALRYSAAMLGELRTSYLSPQKYYELYMQVFDELSNLEAFFAEEHSKGRGYGELYELVQHAGNVLPRLYLMVAVGALYIRSTEAPAPEILRDLVEMTKGVQHPTRGLFLRSFLCQRSRGLLPDAGSAASSAEPAGAAAAPTPPTTSGSIHDSVDFLLTNFIEMNKLWVRMQHQGSARDRDKREAERRQLQDLVGKNLTYLCQLDGLEFALYSGGVLPRILEQVVSCRDELAQQYLMQCLIQGFPDAFHLGTLDALLAALPELQSGVKLHSVMAQLLDRLARYADSDAAVVAQLLEGHAFEKFVESIARVTELHADIAPADLVEMYGALLRFTESVHPEALGNVNRVLGAAFNALAARGLGGDAKAERALVALLALPLAKYDAVTVLTQLDQFPPLMGLLQPRTHKDMAVKVVQAVMAQRTRISTLPQARMMFRFVAPLVTGRTAGAAAAAAAAQGVGGVVEEGEEEEDEEDVAEEQALVAQLLHHLQGATPADTFAILKVAREQLELGGPRRMRYTFPALCFGALRSVRELARAAAAAAADADADADAGAEGSGEESEVSAEAVLQWQLDCALVLAEVPQPMAGLRLLLAGGHVASEEAGLEMLAYEFFEQALTLYEESIAEARQKVVALQAIVGTLHSCHVFGPDNRDALAGSVTAYAAKLLKRSDQCTAVCAASHIAWQEAPAPPPAAAPPAAAAATAPGGEGEAVAVEEEAAVTTAAAPPPSLPPGGVRHPPVRDAQKVMAAMKRALKVVGAAKQQRAAVRGAAAAAPPGGHNHHHHAHKPVEASALAMYLDILNQYIYYFERGAEAMSAGVVQQLLELVGSEVAAAAAAAVPDKDAAAFWGATIAHIEYQKSGAGGADAQALYAGLQPPSLDGGGGGGPA